MNSQSVNEQTSTASGSASEQLYPEMSSAPTAMPAVPSRDRNWLLAFLLIGLGLAMLFANVERGTFRGGEPIGAPFTAPLQGAQTAKVDIQWGSGLLRLGGLEQGDRLLAGAFQDPRRASLDVEHRGSAAIVSLHGRGSGWFPRLSAGRGDELLLSPVPVYELDIETGSGSTQLDLHSLKVSDLKLDAGSGSLDLRLPQAGPLAASVEAGSGSIAVDLAPQAEVQITVDHGSGSLSPGLRLKQVGGERGSEAVYQTPGYASTKEHMDIRIDAGSGSITIR